jgi:hypothetical protein
MHPQQHLQGNSAIQGMLHWGLFQGQRAAPYSAIDIHPTTELVGEAQEDR